MDLKKWLRNNYSSVFFNSFILFLVSSSLAILKLPFNPKWFNVALAIFSTISKDVVLSSAVNIVEIWDKDLYEKAIDESVIDFADLAEDVMGNINDDENGLS